jgi:hypothetical protein
MPRKKATQKGKALNILTDDELQQLKKVAFGNMCDFARFEPDGRVEIFDWEKAREVGARVSITTRKVGRGKNAKEVRFTRIEMPDKARALFKLLEYLVPLLGSVQDAVDALAS